MIKRTLSQVIEKAVKTFPALVVTGPRQSGKTTLLKEMFPKTHQYVNLEDSDIRSRARLDPRLFLSRLRDRVIIDEIQYAPELLSFVKTTIDERRTPGSWLFTGSQNFALMHGVSQSLAGRAAVLSLLPFTIQERIGKGQDVQSIDDIFSHSSRHRKGESNVSQKLSIEQALLRGWYPELSRSNEVDPTIWCGSYITTYLERDVRNLSNIGDLAQFETFLKLCVIRTGQILNLSDLARDAGVSQPTAKRWLSVLESSYQIFLLRPYYRNLGKRLIKAPKLYATDSALATYLLGLRDGQTLHSSPHFGSLFESMVVVDLWKRLLHSGEPPTLYYARTPDGLEIDVLLERGDRLHAIEIKSSATITPVHSQHLERFKRDAGPKIETATLVSLSSLDFPLTNNVYHRNWLSFLG